MRRSDIPALSRCIERGIAVFFASNSAGATGARQHHSTFLHSTPNYSIPNRAAPLPVELLAHLAGPLAVLAHVDVTNLIGMCPLDGTYATDGSHLGLVPFHSMMKRLARGDPLKQSSESIHGNLIRRIDAYRRQLKSALRSADPTDETLHSLACACVAWQDAQGWVMLGDPMVRLKGPQNHG